jgi:hypothetical protein
MLVCFLHSHNDFVVDVVGAVDVVAGLKCCLSDVFRYRCDSNVITYMCRCTVLMPLLLNTRHMRLTMHTRLHFHATRLTLSERSLTILGLEIPAIVGT